MFEFPQVCACCGARPSTTLPVSSSKSKGKKIVHTQSRSWAFPYCALCAEHVHLAARKRAQAIGTLIVGVAAAIAGWFAVLLGCGGTFYAIAAAVGLRDDSIISTKPIILVICHVAAIAAAVCVYSGFSRKAARLRATIESLRGADCVSADIAVAYSGWHGTLNLFDIESAAYAKLFIIANGSKLVNTTPELWALLEPAAYRTQSARRGMS